MIATLNVSTLKDRILAAVMLDIWEMARLAKVFGFFETNFAVTLRIQSFHKERSRNFSLYCAVLSTPRKRSFCVIGQEGVYLLKLFSSILLKHRYRRMCK